MEVDVYDTYARSSTGGVIHFDVLVPKGTAADKAFAWGREWLASIGEKAESLEQRHCRFCHSEKARSNVEKDIREQGYHILQMEGCPDSVV